MIEISKFVRLFGDGNFVICKGKRALNNQMYKATEAQVHINAKGQVGLWIPDGFIVVDIDDREQANIVSKMTNTFRVKTKKGMHFYFRSDKENKQRVKSHTPIGIIIDTRVANKGYVVLPINDPDREIVDENAEVLELPHWLDPLNIPSKSPAYIIPNAIDGSGRNDSLLRQTMRLRSFYTKEEVKEVLDLINKKVYADPLPDSEIDSILNSSDNYAPVERKTNEFLLYTDKGVAYGVNHLALVDYIIQEYRMFILGKDDLYYYIGGVYVNDGMYVRELILKLIAHPKFQRQAEVMAIYRLLLDRKELSLEDDSTNHDKSKINFLNGMYDVIEQNLIPHSPDYLSTIQIPFNYIQNDLNMEDIQFYDFLKRTKLASDDIVMVVKYLAYSLLPTNHLKAFMVLVGQTNTGKSTLINIISKILGTKNVSNLSIHQLSQRFYPSELKNKLLNANADNGSFDLTSIENLKKITGNDKIMWEKKGMHPYFFTPLTRLLFSFNKLPLQVEERSNAFWMRIRILEMNTQLDLSQTYYENLLSDESIISIIPILCRVARDLRVIEPSMNSISLSDVLRNESDSIRAYISTQLEISHDPRVFTLKDEIYISYTAFCLRNDLKAQKRKELFSALENENLKEVRRGEARKYGYFGVRIIS